MKSISASRRSGFTIVELLIVIVVIAILAAISVLAFTGIQQRARNAARFTAAHNIHKQLEIYTRQTGTFFNGAATGVTFCIPTEANYDAGNGGLPDCYQSSAPRSESSIANSNFTAQNMRFSYPNTPIAATNGVTYYGIHVTYLNHTGQGMNGVLRPYGLFFYLEGSDQECGPNSARSNSALSSTDPLNSIVSARNYWHTSEVTLCFLSLTHHSAI